MSAMSSMSAQIPSSDPGGFNPEERIKCCVSELEYTYEDRPDASSSHLAKWEKAIKKKANQLTGLLHPNLVSRPPPALPVLSICALFLHNLRAAAPGGIFDFTQLCPVAPDHPALVDKRHSLGIQADFDGSRFPLLPKEEVDLNWWKASASASARVSATPFPSRQPTTPQSASFARAPATVVEGEKKRKASKSPSPPPDQSTKRTKSNSGVASCPSKGTTNISGTSQAPQADDGVGAKVLPQVTRTYAQVGSIWLSDLMKEGKGKGKAATATDKQDGDSDSSSTSSEQLSSGGDDDAPSSGDEEDQEGAGTDVVPGMHGGVDTDTDRDAEGEVDDQEHPVEDRDKDELGEEEQEQEQDELGEQEQEQDEPEEEGQEQDEPPTPPKDKTRPKPARARPKPSGVPPEKDFPPEELEFAWYEHPISCSACRCNKGHMKCTNTLGITKGQKIGASYLGYKWWKKVCHPDLYPGPQPHPGNESLKQEEVPTWYVKAHKSLHQSDPPPSPDDTRDPCGLPTVANMHLPFFAHLGRPEPLASDQPATTTCSWTKLKKAAQDTIVAEADQSEEETPLEPAPKKVKQKKKKTKDGKPEHPAPSTKTTPAVVTPPRPSAATTKKRGGRNAKATSEPVASALPKISSHTSRRGTEKVRVNRVFILIPPLSMPAQQMASPGDEGDDEEGDVETLAHRHTVPITQVGPPRGVKRGRTAMDDEADVDVGVVRAQGDREGREHRQKTRRQGVIKVMRRVFASQLRQERTDIAECPSTPPQHGLTGPTTRECTRYPGPSSGGNTETVGEKTTGPSRRGVPMMRVLPLNDIQVLRPHRANTAPAEQPLRTRLNTLDHPATPPVAPRLPMLPNTSPVVTATPPPPASSLTQVHSAVAKLRFNLQGIYDVITKQRAVDGYVFTAEMSVNDRLQLVRTGVTRLTCDMLVMGTLFEEVSATFTLLADSLKAIPAAPAPFDDVLEFTRVLQDLYNTSGKDRFIAAQQDEGSSIVDVLTNTADVTSQGSLITREEVLWLSTPHFRLPSRHQAVMPRPSVLETLAGVMDWLGRLEADVKRLENEVTRHAVGEFVTEYLDRLGITPAALQAVAAFVHTLCYASSARSGSADD
ncbi:hypothetical protein LXA43DRAFT_1066361 [Ganoderma leucocontextum]|nr:hypothetical protein LXA43DRAFT_1066361 [Ganoderma leucocontextum]